MREIHAIKPGPKPKKEDGTDDKRRRVDPPTKPKHPDLKPHIPKPKEKGAIIKFHQLQVTLGVQYPQIVENLFL
jgi:hypothetical protein